MEHTANYALTQWAMTDRIQMQDFNADNAKLDAALAAHDSTLAAHTAALTKRGNCQVYIGTYTGTGACGAEHPNQLTLPSQVDFLLVFGTEGFSLPLFRGQEYSYVRMNNGDPYTVPVLWEGNSVQWYTNNDRTQLNERRKTYYYAAFAAIV